MTNVITICVIGIAFHKIYMFRKVYEYDIFPVIESTYSVNQPGLNKLENLSLLFVTPKRVTLKSIYTFDQIMVNLQ